MTVKPISRELAEQALKAVKGQYKVYIEADGEDYAPKLVEAWDGQHWAICWDDGPFEWTLSSPQGGIDKDLSAMADALVETPAAEDFPQGVFAEPYCGTVLCLYPDA
jgi:hypothetical protein